MFKLRPYQEECVARTLEAWKENDRVLVVSATGCHEANQGILMFDGSVKRAIDINVNDLIMGDDGTPRTVLELYRGSSEMYKISPSGCKPFIVNKEHILSLVTFPIEDLFYSTRHEISVENFLKLSKRNRKSCRLYSNKIINEIIDETTEILETETSEIRDIISNIIDSFEISRGNILRKSYSFRKKLFIGINNLLGTLKGNKCIIKTKDEKFANDIVALGRSIGKGSRIRRRLFNSFEVIFEGCHNLFSIEKIEYLGMGDYYGWEIDGNNLYMMDDLIVTHNTGKTCMFAEISEKAIASGKKVLILAHREELLSQASEKLKIFKNIDTSLEKGDKEADLDCSCVVASVQSLSKQKRLDRYDKKHFGLIIVDEAHHVTSNTYMSILNHFEEYKLLGLTATPSRSDQKKLSEIFECKSFEYDLEDAIKDGWLSEISSMVANISIDISNVTEVAGDYKQSELDEAISPHIVRIVDYVKQNLDDRKKIVVFTPRRESAREVESAFNSMGISSRFVSGDTPTSERKQILEDFSNGKIRVLTNALLVVEGYDEPGIDCIINLRPTKSYTLYKQIVGRGTRLFEGKKNVLMLDFIWETKESSRKKKQLCHISQLFAKDDEIAVFMKDQMVFNRNKVFILSRLSELCERHLLGSQRMELARRRFLKWSKKKTSKPDYFIYAFIRNNKNILDFQPFSWYDSKKITQRQKDFLELRCGLNTKEINFGLANTIIGDIVKKSKKGLATTKQVFLLSKFGIVDQINNIDFETASEIITKIANNHWQVPCSVQQKYGGEKRAVESCIVDFQKELEKTLEDHKELAEEI